MARSPTVSKDQEAIIRQFVEGADLTKLHIPREFFTALMALLGYKIAPNGARVHANIELKMKYGTPMEDAFEDTYYDDWAEITADEIANDTRLTDTSSGQ